MKTNLDNHQSFIAGYCAAKTGVIRQELTPREIEAMYPDVQADAFAQGMLDGLMGDDWRYRGVIARANADLHPTHPRNP